MYRGGRGTGMTEGKGRHHTCLQPQNCVRGAWAGTPTPAVCQGGGLCWEVGAGSPPGVQRSSPGLCTLSLRRSGGAVLEGAEVADGGTEEAAEPGGEWAQHWAGLGGAGLAGTPACPCRGGTPRAGGAPGLVPCTPPACPGGPQGPLQGGSWLFSTRSRWGHCCMRRSQICWRRNVGLTATREQVLQHPRPSLPSRGSHPALSHPAGSPYGDKARPGAGGAGGHWRWGTEHVSPPGR